MPKTYTGKRTPTGCVVTVDDSKTVKDLNPPTGIWKHIFTGFDWGHNGHITGQLDLSFALLADCFGNDDDRALDLYQWFKNEWVAAQNRDWQITSDEILLIVSRY